ncbi:MAG: hypothetical protein WD066_15400 [Planctomycetaceae bacterium]
MKVATYEAIVQDGQIKLSEDVRLPEHAAVLVVVPGVREAPRIRVGSPRLAQPARAADFTKQVSQESPDAGLRCDGFNPPAPVAHVEVRHPDRDARIADVPMLIDSGADLSLLPSAAVGSIGIIGTGERYQLVGFDGTISESEAVRADLVVSGRRYRGRFLLTDADVGIVGRDVLNHIRFLLDGPASAWEVLPPD